jgi:hypothetical protein
MEKDWFTTHIPMLAGQQNRTPPQGVVKFL